MVQLLKIAAWNANGLCQHAQEIKLFIQTFNLDFLLVSETHFTNRSSVNVICVVGSSHTYYIDTNDTLTTAVAKYGEITDSG